MSPRTGFFHHFEARETLNRLCDAKSEDSSTEPLSTDMINKYCIENLPYFDEFLGPYPFERYKQWISLTDLSEPELVKRINSNSRPIRSISAIKPREFVSHRKKINSDSKKIDLNDLNHAIKLDEQHPLKFTDIECLQAYPTNSTPQQITRNKIDNTFLLEQLIEAHGGDDNSMLGELQFVFVVFFNWPKLRGVRAVEETVEAGLQGIASYDKQTGILRQFHACSRFSAERGIC